VGSRRSRLEGRGARGLSHFVGRDRELETLQDLFVTVAEGRGQAVGIVGEPGVGKSRLLLEFRHGLADRGVAYLQGRCLSYGASIPYVPVLDVARAACAIGEGDPPGAIAEKARRALQVLGLESSSPYLVRLLGGREASGALDALAPEVIKARTFEMLRQTWLRTSRQQPLVLEIEDLHWIDRTSEECLTFLAESLAEAPVLLIGTYRPGYRPPWSDRSFATQLALGRLAPDESLAVVQSILAAAAPGDPLAQLILDKGEGNPFFLEELARTVGDERRGGALQVPDTVHGVLTARIDRLDEDDKRVLQTASVLGREFTPDLLAAIWDGEGAIDPRLRQLTRLEFLSERATGEEMVYAFKHALTLDVAEATLLPSRRRELHRRAGEALERLHPDRLTELAPRLADHYREAEAWGPASRFAHRAAQAARAVFANREALARYDQGLEAAARADAPPAEELSLREGRADVHAMLGDFEHARADYEAALRLARAAADPLGEARVLGTLAALWGGHKDYDRGLALSREAVAVAEGAGDSPAARSASAEGRLRLGLMELNLARTVASRSDLRRALDLFRAAGDAGGEARALDALAMALLISGELDASIAHGREALPRLARSGNRETEASCLSSLAWAYLFRGRRSEGEACLPRALEAARAIGARGQEAFVHATAGSLAEPYGEWGRAVAEGETALAIARELGHREWTAAALGVLGRVRRNCGDLGGARACHAEMLAITRELSSALWLAEALDDLGQDLVAEGDVAGGTRHLAEALDVTREAAQFWLRPRIALGELALRAGRPQEALAGLEGLEFGASQFALYLPDVRRVEGEALAALGRGPEGEARLHEALAQALGVGAAPATWRAGLALARLLDAAGRPEEARAPRGEARRAVERVASGLSGAPELLRGFKASAVFREAAGA
jgi:tetratricopeptide (TPR) repeat protein